MVSGAWQSCGTSYKKPISPLGEIFTPDSSLISSLRTPLFTRACTVPGKGTLHLNSSGKAGAYEYLIPLMISAFYKPVVTPLLYFQCEFLTGGFYYLTVIQNMDNIGYDIVQQSLVVGDHNKSIVFSP
ncbi:hypothetical protein SDC9_152565 [bioreactor metagenome]|uniref:Uncharacterized protein n=1 Tax=bioreactor metagenome TaxID=1076179 RepID=A0A645ETG0_9ZZZZ